MFIELSREKMFVVGVIVALIAAAIAIFVLVNTLWNILPQTGYDIAYAESEAAYTLLYKWPDGPLQATSTPPGYAKSIPVLLYHGESGGPDMSTSVFIDQMRTLKENGWQTITMTQFEKWEKGEIQLPAKSFLLTFDDGRTDTYYPVDPVLKDLGYNAVMFVITGFSLPPDGKTNGFYLNKTELADMVASGRWELESHGNLDHSLYSVQSTTNLSQAASTTSGHFLSNKFWDTGTNSFETNAQFTARVSNDMKSSVQTLDQDFGINVNAFAYPFNDYGEDSVNFPGSQAILDKVMPSVFAYTFYQTWPGNGDTFNYPLTNNGPGSTSYMIKRFEPPASWSGQDLLQFLDTASAKDLPYQSTSFGNDWTGTWGNTSESAGGVTLSAAPDTTGASAFLNGTGWWTNYYFAATVDWKSGSDVSLLARDSTQDYVACAFSRSSVALERHVRESQTNIATASYAFQGSMSSAHLAIGVVGHEITCFENGAPVVSGYSSSVAAKGGIGVEVWDAGLGVAKSVVTSVSVRAYSGSAQVANAPKSIPSAAYTFVLPPAPIPDTPPTTPTAPAATQPAPDPAPAPQTVIEPSPATTTHATSTNFFRQFMNNRKPVRAGGG